MPNPLFPVTAAARLDLTPGSSTRAAYFALAAQYNFGTPVVPHRAPAELAASLGIPLYSQVGDPGITPTVPGVVVVWFPYAQPSVVVSGVPYPVDVNQPGGTIAGVNYVDPNGVLHPDIDWQWSISVEAYRAGGGGGGGTVTGKYEQQVVNWIGDGVSNRLIPTTIDLSNGVVAVWGCGGADGTGLADANFFRHNQGMTGTDVMGINADPLANGIIGFELGGFRVSPGVSGSTKYGNTAGCKYVAVVCKDSTSDNRYMKAGTYLGFASGSLGVTIDPLNRGSVAYSTGHLFDPSMTGATVSDSSGNRYIFTFVSTIGGAISPPYIPGFIPPAEALAFVTDVPRPIYVAGAANTLTHVWIWGAGVAYKSIDIPLTTSVDLQSGSNKAAPSAFMITSLEGGLFRIVNANAATQDVNKLNRRYNYMAFMADGTFLAQHFFASWQAFVGGLPQTVAGIGFTPALTIGRQGKTSVIGGINGAVWKGLTHTGLDSTFCMTDDPSNDIPTDGITAIGVGSVTYQLIVAAGAAGQPFWGWAFTGGSITPPSFTLLTPPFSPPFSQPNPAGGLIPGGTVPAGGGQGCLIGAAGLAPV